MTVISDQAIENAKSMIAYSEAANHEHNDCIRIAYEWLDAQEKLMSPNLRFDAS